jgi:hypothetical protein
MTAKSNFALTIEDRLKHGNLTIVEVRALRNRSHSGFYEDVKRGLVSVRKIGRKTVVPGPVAVAYIAGLPLPSAATFASFWVQVFD